LIPELQGEGLLNDFFHATLPLRRRITPSWRSPQVPPPPYEREEYSRLRVHYEFRGKKVWGAYLRSEPDRGGGLPSGKGDAEKES